MSKQFRVAIDPQSFKPVIEAMIFASEEPLPVRTLMRLLAGEREEKEAKIPPLTAMMVASEHGLDPEAIADSLIEDDETEPEGGSADEEIVVQMQPAAETEAEDPGALAEAMEGVDARNAGTQVIDQAYVRTLIAELNDEYEATGRAFQIVEVAGGFQFATTRDYGEYVALLSKEKLRRRLSPAALETLAIIAYRQPVAKPEVEAIRGVNCDQVLLSLMEKNLVAITGRSDGVGRPLLYGTTEDFLRVFGLKGLGDLPKLREIEELMEEGAFSPEKAEVITVDRDSAAEEIEARVSAAGHAGHAHEEEHGSIELADDAVTDGAAMEPGVAEVEAVDGEHGAESSEEIADAEASDEDMEDEEGDDASEEDEASDDEISDEEDADGEPEEEDDDEELIDEDADGEPDEEDDDEELIDEDADGEPDEEDDDEELADEDADDIPEEEDDDEELIDEDADGEPDEDEELSDEEGGAIAEEEGIADEELSDEEGEAASGGDDESHHDGVADGAGTHGDVPHAGARLDAHE